MQRVRIIGSPLSPYVRKVLVVLGLKQLEYEIDPLVPFFGDERFARLSPLRRIPVLIDDRATLVDSSVICQYLEDRHPEPQVYPDDLVARAEARWLEEFADTRLADVVIWGLFNELAIGPAVWGRKPDPAVVAQTCDVELPQVLDFLEERLPAGGFLYGQPSIADVSIACFFRNAQFVRYAVDAARWPRTAAFVERVLALPPFVALRAIEEPLLRVPPSQHRERLSQLGVPLMADSFGTSTPRPGLKR